jgi:hypothetical protein
VVLAGGGFLHRGVHFRRGSASQIITPPKRLIIPAPEGTSKSIDAVKGKLSRSEFIRRAILHEIERALTAKLKPTKGKR